MLLLLNKTSFFVVVYDLIQLNIAMIVSCVQRTGG